MEIRKRMLTSSICVFNRLLLEEGSLEVQWTILKAHNGQERLIKKV